MRIILLQVFLEEGLYLVIRNDAGDVVVKIDVGCSWEPAKHRMQMSALRANGRRLLDDFDGKKAECLAPSEGLQR